MTGARDLPRSHKPYPEYRESGVEWLRTVPAHWRVHRLKQVATTALSSVDKHTTEGEEPVRLCNYVDVYHNDRIMEALDFMDATAGPDEVRRFALRAGDVVVTKDSESWDDIAVPAYVPSDLDGVLCGYHLALVRPKQDHDGAFLSRCFSARGINDQFRVEATGITRYGLGKGSLDTGLLPVPPLDEQRAIGAFLDGETAEIDELVAKKERLLDLLKEKRTALITRAVTRGLDPSVSMKDSGVEWLGEIPAHWEAKRLKHVVPELTVGIVVTPAKYYVDSGVPCLRSLNISSGTVSAEDLVFVSPESNDLHRKSKIRTGDLVVVRTGLAGTAALVPPELDGANCIDLLIIRRSQLVGSRFLWYFVNSPTAARQVEAHSEGAIQAHYNTSTLADLVVAVPPRAEQDRIVTHLDRETATLDALGAKVREAIERLKEYRTALISAAVTGKIDVRGERVRRYLGRSAQVPSLCHSSRA